MSIFNWNLIRTLAGSQQEGFEEFVCQLARVEPVEEGKKFIRKGKPDGGVECFWVLEDGAEWAWQAKYFTSSLEKTQWGQIDKSVKTALDKHPNLTRYFIAIPYDPPDARIKGKKSLLQKWGERVQLWSDEASKKGMNVEFIAWWSSDMIGKIQNSSNEGLAYFWFNQEEFMDEWFQQNNDRAIQDLGRRYIPNIYEELSFELPILQEFDALSRNKNFEGLFFSKFDELLQFGFKALPQEPELAKTSKKVNQSLEQLKQILLSIDFSGINLIPIDDIDTVLECMNEEVRYIEEFYSSTKPESLSPFDSSPYAYQEHNIQKFVGSLRKVASFLKSTGAYLLNNPFLLLTGDAGSGKSFLFSDVVARRLIDNKVSLFLLGQHFVTAEDPWTQIKKKLDIACSFKMFLGALNSKAQIDGHRLIIFIDALNEGQGKKFWRQNLKSFIDQIRHYPWLGVAMSLRTSYEELIWPEDYDQFIKLNHSGFEGHEYDAVKLFFTNFSIEQPSIPVLNPEFSNPLFLLLFCEGLNKSGLTKIPEGMHGITGVFELFIKSINKTLSLPENLDFDSSLDFIDEVITAFFEACHQKASQYLTYSDAQRMFVRVCNDYGIESKHLDVLVSEGIFSKNMFCNSVKEDSEEVLYFAYERFSDHKYAEYLLQQNAEPLDAFEEAGNVLQLLSPRSAVYEHRGLVEALSIQLPEVTGKELFEVIHIDVKSSYVIAEAFVESLQWRRLDTIDQKLIDYVKSVIIKNDRINFYFGEVLMSVTSIPNHFFNARFLHKKLIKMKMADRDAWWTVWLKDLFYDGYGIQRLVDWAWSTTSKIHIQKESKLLTAITLSWFLSSPIRALRDKSTKALVNLLKDDLALLIDILDRFHTVDDPYVYERLLAVTYGCVLRSNDHEKIVSVAEYVYQIFFDVDDDIYPHILLRDYARGVIEYSQFIGVIGLSKEQIAKVRPPYKSDFSSTPLKNEELDDRYKLPHSSETWGQNRILSSMTTEYGIGMGGYGDFGRYTFQSSLRNWDVNPDEMSSIAVEWIFEKYGYSSLKHGGYDNNVPSGRGESINGEERIGKKYQWIALHEILAKVSDNCPMNSEQGYEGEDIETYQGPWQPGVRDIDPSMYLEEVRSNQNIDDFWWEPEIEFDWSQDTKSWVLSEADSMNLNSFVEFFDQDGQSWLALESYPEFSEPKELGKDKWEDGHKRVWFQVRSYLVHENDTDEVLTWLKEKDFMGRWMPESSSLYNIFDGEYYWSPAFDYYEDEYYGGSDCCELKERFDSKESFSAYLTTSKYFHEKSQDHSFEESSFSILKPSATVFRGMKLVQTENLGDFIDQTNEVVSFCPSVEFDVEESLLVRKDRFLNFLSKNNLKIIWTVLGEKQFISGDSDEFVGLTEISGVYYLNDVDEVEGAYQINVITPDNRK